MTRRNHLVLFARAPRLGRGKRRLARDVGDVAAWRFHRLTTARLLRRLGGDPRWTTWLAVTPDRAAVRARGLWEAPVRLMGQGPGDLGARLARTMRVMPPGPVVIVGADVPDVRPRHVARAFDLLGRHDAVLGPAEDGGYWLVGLRRRPAVRPPFEGVRWGGPHARADTVANLERRGMSVGFLETLSDVDTGADLRPHHWR
jgi:rSAM/selenodomain-associated transferase 1